MTLRLKFQADLTECPVQTRGRPPGPVQTNASLEGGGVGRFEWQVALGKTSFARNRVG